MLSGFKSECRPDFDRNPVRSFPGIRTYIVTADGTIVTRDLSTDILQGITREAVLLCAGNLQLRIEERPFTVEEIENAAEAFSTSASGLVNPVVNINGKPIGAGKPGSITAHLRQIYVERSRASAI
ncbi:aminotransferase class IV [Mesorhizobium sp. M1088]|uniref:aminotransferase class IV n=1 Tax=Mesorhizobium sp. M1088 TaxID=2957056 RepID=UPI00333B40EC